MMSTLLGIILIHATYYFRVFRRRLKKVFWKEELLLTTICVLALSGTMGFLGTTEMTEGMLPYLMLKDITSLEVRHGFLIRVVVAFIGFVSSMWSEYGNIKLFGYCVTFGYSTILAGTFIMTNSWVAAGGWSALSLACIPALFLSTPIRRRR